MQCNFPDREGKPYSDNGGKFKWNPELMRYIPNDWTVLPLNLASEVQYGYPLSTEKFDITGNPVIRIRDISDNSFSARTTESVSDNYITQTGDLLIGMDGNFQMNYWHAPGYIVNQRITTIRKTILPLMALRPQIEPIINAKASNIARSTVGHLSDGDIKSLYVLIPDKSVNLSVFDTCLFKLCKNRDENNQLIKLRDWLLPMLMNGQATISD